MDDESPKPTEHDLDQPMDPDGSVSGLDPEAAKLGYVFDPESGFHWHPFAEHWYQPSEGIYLDMEGAPLARQDAEAAVAESLARGDGLPEEEVAEEASLAEPVPPEAYELDEVEEVVEEVLPDVVEAEEVFEVEDLTSQALDAEALDAAALDAAALDDEIPQAEPAVRLELPPLPPPPAPAEAVEPAEWAPEAIAQEAGVEAVVPSGEGKFGGLREAGLRVIGNELRLEEGAPVTPLLEAYSDPSEIPTHFAETRRVVVHLQNGAVQRGLVNGADLLAPTITLATPADSVSIETRSIKAVFFMREPNASAPTPTGRKVQLTLSDGRNLQGFAPNPLPSSGGFYLLPTDTVSNTAWIYVYPHAIRDLDLA